MCPYFMPGIGNSGGKCPQRCGPIHEDITRKFCRSERYFIKSKKYFQ